MKTLVKPSNSRLEDAAIAVEEERRAKLRFKLRNLSPAMRKFAKSLGKPKQNLAK